MFEESYSLAMKGEGTKRGERKRGPKFVEISENGDWRPGSMNYIRDYHHMLQTLNYISTLAPEWLEYTDENTMLVGLPICAIFARPMMTSRYVSILLSFSLSRRRFSSLPMNGIIAEQKAWIYSRSVYE